MRKSFRFLGFLPFLAVGLGTLQSTPFGAPTDGRTGSPGDGGKTCVTSGCHSGAVNTVTGMLSSNVPTEGYTPGNTYTLTVTVDGTGKKGFCVSPQDLSGNVIGTLGAGSGNSVTGKGYMTHSIAVTNDPAVWTFTWQAPAAGTGAVNFYGAFATTRFNTRKTVFTIPEKGATGIPETKFIQELNVFPNPNNGEDLWLRMKLNTHLPYQISLLDISGKVVRNWQIPNTNGGFLEERLELEGLDGGVYFLLVEVEGERVVRKVTLSKSPVGTSVAR